MDAPRDTDALVRLIEILIDGADSAVRARVLVETCLAAGVAEAAAIWRFGRDRRWHAAITRGPEALLPSGEQVEACANGELPSALPPRRRILLPGFDLALALGGVTEDDEALDPIEGLLLVYGAVESGAAADLVDFAAPPLPVEDNSLLAHDFRNLLTGIRSGLDVLRTSFDELPEAEVRRFDQNVERSCRRAAELFVEAIGSRPLSSDRAVIALRDAALSERPAFDRAGIAFELFVDHDADAVPVAIGAADADRIARNLLVNAREATATRGTLVRFECRPSRGPLEGIVLLVEDDGPGFPPSLVGRAHEPGVSTKPGAERGNGLAAVRERVDAAGGILRVRNRLTGGARVEVWLPAARPARGFAA